MIKYRLNTDYVSQTSTQSLTLEFMFKWAQINLSTFLSLSAIRIFFRSELLTVPDDSSHS